ncbi:twin-arginine translocase TatA/TatE family subunit [Sphingomonas prati]|uniref:Sec-independent protein translocase protein TatA n=1 Tax=Sphingomonas prati TaxID=1843237 RepID=A0A7W9BPK2_9SPHN|nr:twin-arginine translocase TatA/TatE family subunit [Sphingomonas prati]MBB5727601.1 sec-independent protein translocase protein TatA [Sphingomonas prati]GGE79295.1 Sec-independent protein translocase protein TatA [Sphingomonas prati]
MGISLPHILIFAVVAILLLGGGRFSSMMGDVAKGVKQFKKGMAEEDEDKPVKPAPRLQAQPPVEPNPTADLQPMKDDRPQA